MTNDLHYYRKMVFNVTFAKKALKSEEHIKSAFVWQHTREGHVFWKNYAMSRFNIFKKYRAKKRLQTMIDEYEALTGAKQ